MATPAPGPGSSTCSATRSASWIRLACSILTRTKGSAGRRTPCRTCAPIARCGEAALDALGDDGGRDALARAAGSLSGRAPFAVLYDRLASLSVELDDVVGDLRDALEGLDEDPARLDEVRTRRHVLHELRRKYGETLADVIAYRDEATARLADLESHGERVVELEAERAALERAEAAGGGRGGPRPAGGRAGSWLAPCRPTWSSWPCPRRGWPWPCPTTPRADEVTFQLAANPGDPPLPLARVASGGELARTMLALRLVLTEAPDTLLFDEVDAGVGGEAALAVGRSLARLAQRHQVLVVTHLAQVAAFAEHHVVVDKRVAGSRTVAEARPLEGDERVVELARMLSGMSDSGSARRHAEELLDGARSAVRSGS